VIKRFWKTILRLKSVNCFSKLNLLNFFLRYRKTIYWMINTIDWIFVYHKIDFYKRVTRNFKTTRKTFLSDHLWLSKREKVLFTWEHFTHGFISTRISRTWILELFLEWVSCKLVLHQSYVFYIVLHSFYNLFLCRSTVVFGIEIVISCTVSSLVPNHEGFVICNCGFVTI